MRKSAVSMQPLQVLLGRLDVIHFSVPGCTGRFTSSLKAAICPSNSSVTAASALFPIKSIWQKPADPKRSIRLRPKNISLEPGHIYSLIGFFNLGSCRSRTSSRHIDLLQITRKFRASFVIIFAGLELILHRKASRPFSGDHASAGSRPGLILTVSISLVATASWHPKPGIPGIIPERPASGAPSPPLCM